MFIYPIYSILLRKTCERLRPFHMTQPTEMLSLLEKHCYPTTHLVKFRAK